MAHLLHGLRDALAIERLQQVIDGVHLERLHRILIVSGGEDNLRQWDFAVQQLLDDAESVQPRHLHVEEDQIGRELLDQAHRLDAVLALRQDVDIEFAQQVGKLVARQLFVVNDDCRKCHPVSCTWNCSALTIPGASQTAEGEPSAMLKRN